MIDSKLYISRNSPIAARNAILNYLWHGEEPDFSLNSKSAKDALLYISLNEVRQFMAAAKAIYNKAAEAPEGVEAIARFDNEKCCPKHKTVSEYIRKHWETELSAAEISRLLPIA